MFKQQVGISRCIYCGISTCVWHIYVEIWTLRTYLDTHITYCTYLLTMTQVLQTCANNARHMLDVVQWSPTVRAPVCTAALRANSYPTRETLYAFLEEDLLRSVDHLLMSPFVLFFPLILSARFLYYHRSRFWFSPFFLSCLYSEDILIGCSYYVVIECLILSKIISSRYHSDWYCYIYTCIFSCLSFLPWFLTNVHVVDQLKQI